MRQCVKDIGKYSFPCRMIDKWNVLNNEIVTAQNVHNFKEELHKWRQDTMSPTRTLYNTTR
ncbi:hypothetical protein E2C01_018971 [Portunus trituberculatus]|uniref:Uncharacterized protein n=1 Tax=Portunus trituberculatus TaxID=210409 RepID=A0A5B7DWP7_PORTR|nr:hypothetical protein [Portunus trituberculatus]